MTMKFFPVICGLPTHCVSLQHDVIILLAGWSCGPRISFPMKSSCRPAIMFLTQDIGIEGVAYLFVSYLLVLDLEHGYFQDAAYAFV